MTYDLETDVVPRLSRCIGAIEHIFERLIEIVEIRDSRVAGGSVSRHV